ncbi:MAG: hypothetical protein A2511_00415 [Deltaproteobacteria bacterium RIFOXYD12_FULL_50_9]|nr:MAG: hypothetical protein A2511_00415 [Deltaproteobacteria bacterium RIFOXYD12_FULL_50_9]
MAKNMKTITSILLALLVPLTTVAGECPPAPNTIEKAINEHIQKIRASEYCPARSIQSQNDTIIAVYTAEGECGEDKETPPGACSVNWVRYMVGSLNGKIIGPVIVGGKGGLADNEIKIKGNIVELVGLTIGPNDALCCPSVPSSKRFGFSENGFKEIKP